MTQAALGPLHRLVGQWTTEATHPAMPGVVVHGTVSIEWLEGEQFLIHRSRCEHADFPDSISIIGFTGQDRATGDTEKKRAAASSPLSMHYFDSRGVFRVYDVVIDDATWRISRDAPGFSQRFTGTVADGGNTILGRWQLREDTQWNDDLEITYRRA